MATPAVERAYYAASRADDRYEAALQKAGISRWSGKTTPAVTRAYRAKVRADARYQKAGPETEGQSDDGETKKENRAPSHEDERAQDEAQSAEGMGRRPCCQNSPR